MLAHAEVPLARQAPTDVLFHEATSNETAILADRLSGGFEHEIARQDARAANYEHGVLAVIGVLCAVKGASNSTRTQGTSPSIHTNGISDYPSVSRNLEFGEKDC